jgi:hypothetical protein
MIREENEKKTADYIIQVLLFLMKTLKLLVFYSI